MSHTTPASDLSRKPFRFHTKQTCTYIVEGNGKKESALKTFGDHQERLENLNVPAITFYQRPHSVRQINKN